MVDVIVVMVIYYWLKKRFEGITDVDGKIVKEPTNMDKVYSVLLTGVYSTLVVLFNVIYKEVAIILTELENFQYQTQYDNYLIAMQFQFSFLNFYLPLFILAFIDRSYFTLFMMMATQMSYKQIGKNLFDRYYPMFLFKNKLDDLSEKFKKFISKENLNEQELQIIKSDADKKISGTMIRRYQSIRDG